MIGKARRRAGRLGDNMPRSVYTDFADGAEVREYLDSAEDWLHRVRKVKGFAVTVPDAATGCTKVVDIAARDENEARLVSEALRHTPLAVETFKGVVRGKPKAVRDAGEREALRATAQSFLQRSRESKLAPGSMPPTVQVVKVRRAKRYGENVYVMVVRYMQTNHPSPGWEGGSIHKGDQGLAFAGQINLNNTALGF